MSPASQWDRLREYARRRSLIVGAKLGDGGHGIVFRAENQSQSYFCALKAHHAEIEYAKERDAYLRLRDNNVNKLRGCAVPKLIGFDDELLVVEMTIVTPPFVLDFAGAFLDWEPGFSEDVLADWHAERGEEFGSRWPLVQLILEDLKQLGIFMADVHSRNITFPN